MKGRLLLVFMMLIIPVWMLSDLAMCQDPPEEIMINNSGYRRKVHGGVAFPHLAHSEDYGFECKECHHEYKKGENVWEEGDPVKRCIVCHNPKKKQGRVPRLQFAYHFSCRKCHREIESGPIECKECHQK